MHNRHALVSGKQVLFRFRGKSGKFHEISLSDARLAAIVRRCQDLPGHHLFEYYDSAGEVHKVTSTDVNEYLHAVAGADFSAKDFRTWTATVMVADLLKYFECGGKRPGKSGVFAIIDKVADALGNTRAVCRKYYIHPALLASFPEPNKKPRSRVAGRKPRLGLTVLEYQLLRYLENLKRT